MKHGHPDRAPVPKRVIEYSDESLEMWRHEIKPGERVTVAIPEGMFEGTVITKDMAQVTVNLKNGGRANVKVDDVFKIHR